MVASFASEGEARAAPYGERIETTAFRFSCPPPTRRTNERRKKRKETNATLAFEGRRKTDASLHFYLFINHYFCFLLRFSGDGRCSVAQPITSERRSCKTRKKLRAWTMKRKKERRKSERRVLVGFLFLLSRFLLQSEDLPAWRGGKADAGKGKRVGEEESVVANSSSFFRFSFL